MYPSVSRVIAQRNGFHVALFIEVWYNESLDASVELMKAYVEKNGVLFFLEGVGLICTWGILC